MGTPRVASWPAEPSKGASERESWPVRSGKPGAKKGEKNSSSRPPERGRESAMATSKFWGWWLGFAGEAGEPGAAYLVTASVAANAERDAENA
jgi:hypothetical protein